MSRMGKSQGKPRSSSSNISGPGKQSSIMKKPSSIMSKTGGKDKSGKPKPEEEQQQTAFTLPAYSLGGPPKLDAAAIEKLKKRTIRRHAPPGEDLKEIKKIIAGLKGQDISVQEFIGLIGPYTSDRGSLLKRVLQEDLNNFRKLARKVYETMTQDVSDVLLNEQVDLSEFYRERKAHLKEKMLSAINEVFTMVPEFDFERYEQDKEAYLAMMLPLPKEMCMDDEDVQLQRRQEAYHRLQWLKSEGERLAEENNRLQQRLNELKRQQLEEHRRAAAREESSARKRDELMATEAGMKDQVEQLHETVEKSIIDVESDLRKDDDDKSNIEALKPKAAARKKAAGKKGAKPGTEWNALTAAQIEALQKDKVLQGEISKVSIAGSRTRLTTKASTSGAVVCGGPCSLNKGQGSVGETPRKERQQPQKVTQVKRFEGTKTNTTNRPRVRQ